MQRFSNRNPLLLSAALAALSAASLSFAAEPGDKKDDFLDTVVVTARRMEERLQDVPISITVFNQEQISARNMLNADDLARTVPSLSVNTNYGSENSAFNLRGFAQDIGTQPTVGVYFADVVAPRGGSAGLFAGDGAGSGTLFDLQNVQVLKGPQGTLQGRNTTGGSILLVPQKPTDRLEGYVEANTGNYDARGLQAVLNIPLSDAWRMRLGVDSQSRDGYLVNNSGIGPQDFNDVNYTALRASIVGELTPEIENYTIASYSDSSTHGMMMKLISVAPAAQLPAFVGAMAQLQDQSERGFYDVYSIMPDAGQKVRKWQVINTTTWQATDNVTVKNIISYAELHQERNEQMFGSNFFMFGNPNFPIYQNMLHAPPGLDTNSQSTFTEEFRLQGTALDGRLQWQGGVYFEKARPDGWAGVNTVALGYCDDVGTYPTSSCYGFGGWNWQVAKTTYQDKAVYGQATYELTDQLSLTGGLRGTWDEMESRAQEEFWTIPMVPMPFTPTEYCVEDWQQAPPGGCPLREMSQKSRALTYLLGIDYKPTEDMLLYAKYARGYRAGGVKNDAPNLMWAGGRDFRTFKPEKLDSYEVGLKSVFADAQLFDYVIPTTFNLAAFYNEFDDQQVSVGLGFVPDPLAPSPGPVNGAPTSAPMNVGKSRIWGVETDLQLTPFEGLQLTVSYAYLNSRVTELEPVPAIFFANGFVNPQPLTELHKPLTLTPKNKVMLNATYTLPLDPDIGKVSIGATFTHTDKQYTNFANDQYLALYGTQYVAGDGAPIVDNTNFGILPRTNLLDLNASWEDVMGMPLDLTFWATNITRKEDLTWVPGMLGYGYEFGSVAQPRMYGFKLKWKFGGDQT